MRAFLAVPVPKPVLDAIGCTQRDLESRLGAKGVCWLRPSQIHLTLAFLGNVAADRLEALSTVLAQSCQAVAPLTLRAETLGGFPDLRRLRVLWVGLAGDLEPLGHLQARVAAAALPFVGRADDRQFQPHLTIARLKPAATAARHALGRAIPSVPAAVFGEWRVSVVDLMRSELTSAGAVYHRLLSLPLGLSASRSPHEGA